MTEEQINSNSGSYSAENIQVLEGLEAVRKRPAMYIGDISTKGLHHLVYEVVDNSIDEALAGYCDHIEVTINEDNSITVQDNGRGIPVDFHEKEQKSALEVVMTVLHAGGKFDKGSYKVSGGLHGVGVSCVNALSTHMTTQVFRNGKIYQQEYECGHPLYPVKEIGTSDITGTRQQFWPDNTIFTETVYNYEILATRMRELAYLNAGIKITLTDLRVKDEENNAKMEVFYSEEGLKEFVRYIDSSREHLVNDVIYINTEKQGTPVEVAIMYNTSYNENIHSYVNNINTIEDVMENMMCDLGIGGFMGIEDIKPGMKIDLQLVGQEDVQYLGELIEQLPEGLLVSCQKKLTVNGSASCMLQVTAGNILYCWDKATISPAPESGEHAFRITITTRPRINNRRKYPRMDLNNTCTIKFKNSDTEYAATMENISANGFAFLATDKIFTQSKNADVIITIHDFALPNHNVLEGRIIRCSDDNGLYIVGCQMPEDNFYILEYVEKNLNK